MQAAYNSYSVQALLRSSRIVQEWGANFEFKLIVND